jgi:hypothetical protein
MAGRSTVTTATVATIPLAATAPPDRAGWRARFFSLDEKQKVNGMLVQLLIKNTTGEQREKIIRDSLDCGGGGRENCSACDAYGAGDPVEMYQLYIDGEKEIDDTNREFNARYLG